MFQFIPQLTPRAYLTKIPTWLISLVVFSLLTGCSATSRSPDTALAEPEPGAQQSDQAGECPPQNAIEQAQNGNLENESTEIRSAAIWPTPVCPKPKIKKCPVCTAVIVANKPVLGEYERVTVDPPGYAFMARIDTGATSTALHASEITRFERDGQKWVRFLITNPDNGETTTMESKLTRRVRIKQADDLLDRRLIVMMTLHLGDIERQVEVSLTDRSNMEFPLLIGRNFLLDTAVVDVSLRRTVN